MRNMNLILCLVLVIINGCNTKEPDIQETPPDIDVYLSVSPSDISIKSTGGEQIISITCNTNWTVSSKEEWIILSQKSGGVGNTTISVSASSNYTGTNRSEELIFSAGSTSKKCSISQETGTLPNYVPEGYVLIWQDEFNEPRQSNGKPAMPDLSKWYYETGNHGWGNNEIQNYIAGFAGKDTCAQIYGGTLKIIAKQVGNQVFSIRMNTNQSWTYGYFETRMKLPAGKGTWPAFWMLPKNFVKWPDDGEIDIMEHVGYAPNFVHSTVHTKAYNHSIGTQVGNNRYISSAITDFHVYAVEWTEDFIYGYIDGLRYFTFPNDHTGNKDTWPFNVPFYLKLNLAWGGGWGGAQGLDYNALPATYEIDYVRVYEKE